ncbi:MAG: ParA family protein [Nocardioidaceae bacterium]
MSTPAIASGLGWPADEPVVSASVGLGWPDAVAAGPMRCRPALEAGPPRVLGQGWPAVSRETAAPPPSALGFATVQERAAATYPGENADTPLASATEHASSVAAGRPVRLGAPKPSETRVLVVVSQKGGVGKTTTTVNLAAALAQHGMRVLVIDLDPQGNASTALSIDHAEGTAGTYEVLVGAASVSDVLVACAQVPGLFVLPATISLASAEIDLVSMVARETRLKRGLDAHLEETAAAGDRYDFVFVDCPPSLGLLTVNALSAGQEMLIPIQCEYYALEGLSHLMRTTEDIRVHLNPQLRIGAIILTMFDARTRLAAGVAEEVRRHFGEAVLNTAVPRSVRISEAPSYGQTVLTYDPGSTGALSYLEAANELLKAAPALNGRALDQPEVIA